MAVRTKELGSVHVASGSAQNLYTCPAGKTAIVKSIRLANEGTLGLSFTFSIVRSAQAYVIHYTQTLAGTTSTALEGLFIVLEPSDTLRVQASGSSSAYSCWVSGSELVGIA